MNYEPFLHPGCSLIGKATVGGGSSVWPGAVLRGDLASITVGRHTSIQDNTVIHCDGRNNVILGDFVTVGHGSVIHGSVVEDCVVIGMKSVLLDRVRVGKGSVVAAGSVVKQGTVIPPFSLAAGNPAVIKENRYNDYYVPLESALIYFLLSRHYIRHGAMDHNRIDELYAYAREEARRLDRMLSSEKPSSLANLEISPPFEI